MNALAKVALIIVACVALGLVLNLMLRPVFADPDLGSFIAVLTSFFVGGWLAKEYG